jgi:hypothetical protein
MTEKMQQRGIKDDPKAKDIEFDLTGFLTDMDSLTSQARLAEDCEAYYPVVKQEHFRIGIVVSAAPDAAVACRIEVLLQVLANNARSMIADLERTNSILGILSSRGYSLEHHGNCWALCERTVAVDDIEEECREMIAIIQSTRSVKTRSEEVPE